MSKFNKEFSKILMDNNIGSCDLKIESTLLKNVVGVMGAPGASNDPKADVVFVDKNKNLIGYTSLKEGTNVKNFQQWGGLSKIKDPEVSDFIKRLKDYLKTKGYDGVPSGEMIWSEIESNRLKNEVAWGLNYSNSNFGVENVQFIMQGDPILSEIKSNYVELKVSHLITRSFNEIEDKSSPYRPIFCALFRSDRNDFGINKTRVFAYAYDGRKRKTDLTKTN